jgi:hypothetical protein
VGEGSGALLGPEGTDWFCCVVSPWKGLARGGGADRALGGAGSVAVRVWVSTVVGVRAGVVVGSGGTVDRLTPNRPHVWSFGAGVGVGGGWRSGPFVA